MSVCLQCRTEWNWVYVILNTIIITYDYECHWFNKIEIILNSDSQKCHNLIFFVDVILYGYKQFFNFGFYNSLDQGFLTFF